MKPKPTRDSLRARLARLISPGWSWCDRCGMPWNLAKEHSIPSAPGRGAFPCCKKCWPIMTKSERRGAVNRLIDSWQQDSPNMDFSEDRAALLQSVEDGL